MIRVHSWHFTLDFQLPPQWKLRDKSLNGAIRRVQTEALALHKYSNYVADCLFSRNQKPTVQPQQLARAGSADRVNLADQQHFARKAAKRWGYNAWETPLPALEAPVAAIRI